MDPKVRTSPDIREPIYKAYPGVVIRNARTTAGGSLLIELDNKATADRVKNNWNKDLFGGNKGVVNRKINPPAGIIKHIPKSTLDENTTEEDIINEILSSYPEANVDIFKRNDKFTGTIKIEFKSEEDFETAMKNRVKIFEQNYIMERYQYRPKVIICRYCQIFGHVYRVCGNRNKGYKPRCGKCTSTDHETKDCTKNPEEYKCSHCEKNHETGSRVCEVFKSKLESIEEGTHNG